MRTILVIVGAVVLVVGAVLLFVPIVPQASQKVSSNSASPYVFMSVSGFSLTGTIPVAVSWSANATVTVVAAACTSACNTISGLSSLTIQSGRSGSFTLNQPDGGEVIFGIANSSSPASATFNVTTATTTVGSILLIVGIVILIVGVVLKSKGKAMPAAQPMPAPPAETPAESTPDSMMGPPSP